MRRTEQSKPDEVQAVDYRGRAAARVEVARAHLASGDVNRMIYACLDARLAIESLTYELVKIYRNDLDPATLAVWEPRKLFDELKALDPDADASMSIRIAGPSGDFDGPDALEFKEHRMSERWARKMHGTLGGFLHERLLMQLEAGKDLDEATVKRKVTEVLDELDKVLASNGFNLRFRQSPKFDCTCGASVTRFIARTQDKVPVDCQACGKAFIIERQGPSEFRVLEWVGRQPDVADTDAAETHFPFGRWVSSTEKE